MNSDQYKGTPEIFWSEMERHYRPHEETRMGLWPWEVVIVDEENYNLILKGEKRSVVIPEVRGFSYALDEIKSDGTYSIKDIMFVKFHLDESHEMIWSITEFAKEDQGLRISIGKRYI